MDSDESASDIEPVRKSRCRWFLRISDSDENSSSHTLPGKRRRLLSSSALEIGAATRIVKAELDNGLGGFSGFQANVSPGGSRAAHDQPIVTSALVPDTKKVEKISLEPAQPQTSTDARSHGRKRRSDDETSAPNGLPLQGRNIRMKMIDGTKFEPSVNQRGFEEGVAENNDSQTAATLPEGLEWPAAGQPASMAYYDQSEEVFVDDNNPINLPGVDTNREKIEGKAIMERSFEISHKQHAIMVIIDISDEETVHDNNDPDFLNDDVNSEQDEEEDVWVELSGRASGERRCGNCRQLDHDRRFCDQPIQEPQKITGSIDLLDEGTDVLDDDYLEISRYDRRACPESIQESRETLANLQLILQKTPIDLTKAVSFTRSLLKLFEKATVIDLTLDEDDAPLIARSGASKPRGRRNTLHSVNGPTGRQKQGKRAKGTDAEQKTARYEMKTRATVELEAIRSRETLEHRRLDLEQEMIEAGNKRRKDLQKMLDVGDEELHKLSEFLKK